MRTLEQPVVEPNFRIHFHNLYGLTLIETLLVLAVAAMIVMTGINQYQQYSEAAQITAVKSDIREISAALDRYFYTTGCRNHQFPPARRDPSITDLGLAASFMAREPLVTAYHVHVIDSQQVSVDGKPIYLLQIVATLTSNLTQPQLHWYQQLLNAGQVDTGAHELTWQTMPNHRFADAISVFAGIDGTRAIFRKNQNGKDSSLLDYCIQ